MLWHAAYLPASQGAMAMSERIQTKALPWVAFALVSAACIGLVYWGFRAQDDASPIQQLWLFYAPAWLLANMLFGGIHNAPAWSFFPSVVLAVVGQNLVLWRLCSWLSRHMQRWRGA